MADMPQKPSLCRDVLYQSYKPAPCAAKIIGVREEAGVTSSTVDVVVFTIGPGGIFFYEQVPYDADGKPGTWRWPPRV